MSVPERVRMLRLAYILWLFLGLAGAHRLYLRRRESGIFMAVLLAAAGIGMWLDRQGGDSIIYLAIFAGLVVWMAVDAFMIPRWVRRLLRKHDVAYGVIR